MSEKFLYSTFELKELQHRICDFEDEVAYKKIFFHFFLPLKNFSFSFVKSSEIAEEIVSDLLLEIWIKRKQISNIENLRMYLYVSVRNASIRKFKQIQKTIFFSLDNLQVEFACSLENGESVLLNRELTCAIEKAIHQLPQRCKLIFKLAKEDQLKYKEIAELLNISVKTIDHQVSIAIKKIAKELHYSLKTPS